jgi:N-methylhydantoinase B
VLNSIALTYPDGEKHIPMSKDIVEGIPSGTVYRQIAGGGGGYGKPEDRDRNAVKKDLRNEVITEEQAKEEYKL